MNAVLNSQQSAGDAGKLIFLRKLQSVTNRIHATTNIDQIMLDLSPEICTLFNCDRFTLYAVSEDKAHIVSKVKTGLSDTTDLRLPISEHSVAGYTALHRKIVNLHDVYDEAELRSHSPELHFLQEVDRRTGYRTRQMLTAPIVDTNSGQLLGVVQLINTLSNAPFTVNDEDSIRDLCATLAIAFVQRQNGAGFVRSRYDALVTDAVISQQELDEATRNAREKNCHIEAILIDEFKVKPAMIGKALVRFYGVPYEPYKADRIKSIDLLKNLKRQYVEQSLWLPIEEGKDGVLVMAVDPEQVKSSRVIHTIFPKAQILYRVTTRQEFTQTVKDFFGDIGDTGSVGDLLSGMGDDEDSGEISESDLSTAAENELVKLVNKIIVDAYRQGASDIHIEPRPGKEKTIIRFRKDGSLEPYIEIPSSYRNALLARIKIMCDLDISERRKPQDGKIKFKKYGPLDIELRVATIPSAGGVEDVVMRILAAGEPIPLEKLGVLPHNLARLKDVVSKPYGLFFVCGPTGSGKTTTLHSVLHHLNTPDTKIWTAEDPVEITQKGLRQVQVNRKAGLDFAPRCTPIARPSRWYAYSTWEWIHLILPMHCSESSRNVLPNACVRTANRHTIRRQKKSMNCSMNIAANC